MRFLAKGWGLARQFSYRYLVAVWFKLSGQNLGSLAKLPSRRCPQRVAVSPARLSPPLSPSQEHLTQPGGSQVVSVCPVTDATLPPCRCFAQDKSTQNCGDRQNHPINIENLEQEINT